MPRPDIEAIKAYVDNRHPTDEDVKIDIAVMRKTLAYIAELEEQESQPQDVVSRESRQATQRPWIVSADCIGWSCTYDKNGTCLTCGRQQGYESHP